MKIDSSIVLLHIILNIKTKQNECFGNGLESRKKKKKIAENKMRNNTVCKEINKC